MSETGFFCFGYGSLVNRDTHAFTPCDKVELIGWRRNWHHPVMGRRAVTSLSIEPDDTSTIKGLRAWVAPDQVADLDAREKGYARTNVPLFMEAQDAPQITYVSRAPRSGDKTYPILQSYLDAVLMGFLAEFGEAGVHHFVETTAGWDTPILRDRETPFYPRAVDVSSDQAAFFEDALKPIAPIWID